MLEHIDYERARPSPCNGAGGAEDVERCAALEQEVARLEADVTSERERHLRTLADFDNYRRRVRQERAGAEQAETRDILLALLDVMDDFDRAISHVGDASDAVADGLRLIRRRLDGVLRSNGVAAFESAGHPFDPTVHDAMRTVESDEHESGIVTTEDRRGYRWNGVLLRPARVTVAR